MEPPRCRILVMASGSGSNFQALCDAVSSGRVPDSVIIRLIVNRKQAYATHRAERLAIPWDYFNLVSHGFQAKSEHDPAMVRRARDAYDAALAEKVLAIDPRPDLIVLAGWMHIFSDAFLNPVAAAGVKVINLHPALPGESFVCHGLSALILMLPRQIRRCSCHSTGLCRFSSRQTRRQQDGHHGAPRYQRG